MKRDYLKHKMSKVHQTVDVGLKTFAPIKSSGEPWFRSPSPGQAAVHCWFGQLSGLLGVPDGLHLFVVGSNLVPVGLVDLIPSVTSPDAGKEEAPSHGLDRG